MNPANPDLAFKDAKVKEFKPSKAPWPPKPPRLSEEETPALVIHASPFVFRDPRTIAPCEWLYGRQLIRQFMSATVAPGGLGKSALKVVDALSMATARTVLHDAPICPLRVWYWNGEDPQEETERRFAAACIHYGITEEALGDRLFLDSGRDLKICIAKDEKAGFSIAVPQVTAIIDAIRRDKIDVMIIDPFVKSHAVGESDNTKIDAVATQWASIASATNCAIEIVHHVRKGGSGEESEYTIDDSRGAGALINAVRSARVLNRMSKEKAPAAQIDPLHRWSYFRSPLPQGSAAQSKAWHIGSGLGTVLMHI